MNRSESLKGLATALAKAQSQIKAAPKDSENPHFRSRYADLASVWDACREALTANGLAVLQPPAADGNSVTITTLLVHESGEWLSESLTLTAKDASPQSVGSAITYGRRYGLAAMVGVCPDDDDGEAAQPRPGDHPEPAYQPQRQPERSNGQPSAPARQSGQSNGQPPRSGKALFAWTKDQDEQHEIMLLKHLNTWGKLQDFPPRMVDWSAEQVALAHKEAVRKIAAAGRVERTADAPANPDERTCWQLVSDAAAKTNDAFLAGHPNAEMVTDAPRATGRLLWLATQAGKSRYAGTETDKLDDIVHAMEEVYANHRQWVWAELKKVMAEAVRDAEKEVKV